MRAASWTVVGCVCVIVCGAMGAVAASPWSQDVADGKIDVAQVITLHNEARAEAKLPPLTSNPKLEAAAKVQAKDQADRGKMDHVGGDGSTFAERIDRQGYLGRASGENVAMAYKTSRQVHDAWMESPPHKKNILGDFAEMGVACYVAEDGVPYWCVTFGTPWPEIREETAVPAMLAAINAARAEANLPALEIDPLLGSAAMTHTKDMASAAKFLQEDADGEIPTARAQTLGYAAKALAQTDSIGQVSPEQAVRTWLDAEYSKKTLLGDFDHIGVGAAADAKGVPYWSVILGKPRPVPKFVPDPQP